MTFHGKTPFCGKMIFELRSPLQSLVPMSSLSHQLLLVRDTNKSSPGLPILNIAEQHDRSLRVASSVSGPKYIVNPLLGEIWANFEISVNICQQICNSVQLKS